LQAVNGVQVNNTAALAAAYAPLDRGSRISLAVLRNQEQLRFEYFIQ
jgi:hypothetical protein